MLIINTMHESSMCTADLHLWGKKSKSSPKHHYPCSPHANADCFAFDIIDEFQFNPISLPNVPRSNDTSSSANFSVADPLFTATQAQSISSLPTPGVKRKLELLQSNLTPNERARLEAEEDKRRRNTAASARFRVKKKQREQALEKTAKEMTEKANRLEKRVRELEMENKWLKGLITERTGGKEFSALFAKFLADNGDNSHSEDDIKGDDDLTVV
jgi:hypothetical protein